jgi:hypothetical protein
MYLAPEANDVRKSGGRWSATKFLTLLLATMMSSTTFLFLAPSRCALASPSSTGSSSWWEGIKFEDSDTNISGEQHNVIEGVGGPMIQIPCGLMIMATPGDNEAATTSTTTAEDVLPLSTIIDTSLSVSTIESSMLQQYPQLQALVRRLPGDEKTSPPQHYYYLPTGTVQFRMGSVEATVVAPALKIVNSSSTHDQHNDSWELRLGLDFLRHFHARLDLGEDEESLQLRVSSTEQEKGKVVTVPLIRPRPSFNVGDQDEAEL